jgi:hypothetical protein
MIKTISNPMAALLLGTLIAAASNTDLARGMQTERVYLSGQGPSDAVEWDFYCSSGRRSGEWTTIPVPSNWEQHGFGGYDYGHVPADEKQDEVGTYKTTFMVPKEWEKRIVRLVFEGSMTETSIKVNGQAVGAPHLGGYLPFSFPLNADNHFRKGQMPPLLRYGEENVTAKRWLGGGPYRIWANRLQGPQFGLWANDYNDTIPGVTWDYPAFKGVFGDVDWMSLDLSTGQTLQIDPQTLADVGVLRPDNLKDAGIKGDTPLGSRKAKWYYPESGGLFLFHKVPAVGTKFRSAAGLGPQSEPQRLHETIKGQVVFLRGSF